MTDQIFNLLLLSAQAVTALVLAIVFLGYYRLYQRFYLACWSISFVLLTGYTVLSSASGYLVDTYAADHPLRLALTAGSLVASYAQVFFLLLGVWSLANARQLKWAMVGVGLVVIAVLAVSITLIGAFDPDDFAQRLFWRVHLRYLLTGAAFLVAAIWLWAIQREQPRMGRYLVGAGFALYGLHSLLIVVVAMNGMRLPGSELLLLARGLTELVIFFAVGMGMVMWLLEVERERAKVATQRAEYLDNHDPVTGLPNQRCLVEALASHQRNHLQVPFVLYLIGIDRFRALNESAGLRGGDRYLRNCAERLSKLPWTTLVTARIAGDIFAVVLPGERAVQHAQTQARQLCSAMSFRPSIGGFNLPMTASVGYALYPDNSDDVEELIGCAQAALAAGKDGGRGAVSAWQSGMQSSRDLKLTRELTMRGLLASEQLCLYYQPIIDLHTGATVALEALVRWQHPEHGIMPPSEFLPQIQESGLMGELDERVLGMAMGQIAHWQAEGRDLLPVAVNLSAEQFQNENLVKELLQRLRHYAVDPCWLQLEVTENTAMVDIQAGTQTLQRLRDEGISVSIDDFGTGYSSLAYLAELPVDKIKIDRRFIQALDASGGTGRMVNAIVSMVHHIGPYLVGEGVETERQRIMLKATGCEQGQGYLFSRPVPAESVFGSKGG